MSVIRRLRRPARAVLLAAGLALLAPTPTVEASGGFSIHPVRVAFAPGGSVGRITVTNRSEDVRTLQVDAFRWHDSPTSGLEPTRALIAVPPVFELAPGERQVVRLALRGDHRPGIEQAFRLVVGEVPEARPATMRGVTFALRFNIPVFVTPDGALPQPHWHAAAGPDGTLELRVDNDGSAHLQLDHLRLRHAGDGRLLHEIAGPAYVLAGRSGRFRLPDGTLAAGVPVRIEAKTNIGEIDALLQPQGG